MRIWAFIDVPVVPSTPVMLHPNVICAVLEEGLLSLVFLTRFRAIHSLRHSPICIPRPLWPPSMSPALRLSPGRRLQSSHTSVVHSGRLHLIASIVDLIFSRFYGVRGPSRVFWSPSEGGRSAGFRPRHMPPSETYLPAFSVEFISTLSALPWRFFRRIPFAGVVLATIPTSSNMLRVVSRSRSFTCAPSHLGNELWPWVFSSLLISNALCMVPIAVTLVEGSGLKRAAHKSRCRTAF